MMEMRRVFINYVLSFSCPVKLLQNPKKEIDKSDGGDCSFHIFNPENSYESDNDEARG